MNMTTQEKILTNRVKIHKMFLDTCVKRLGLAFHPDTDFKHYIDDEGKPVYSMAQSIMLNKRINVVFSDFATLGLDIYEETLNTPTWVKLFEEVMGDDNGINPYNSTHDNP